MCRGEIHLLGAGQTQIQDMTAFINKGLRDTRRQGLRRRPNVAPQHDRARPERLREGILARLPACLPAA
jgi:hypothetical protein